LKYRLVGGVRFYDRKEIKDILAYCKLLVNPNDDNAFERIVNCPPRGIGNKTLQVIRNSKIDENLSFINYLKKYINNEDFSLLSKRATKALRDFIIIYNKLMKQTEIQEPFDLINSIITLTSYDDYLRNDEDGSERLENINELKSSAEEFSANIDKNPKESLIEFIETASLNTNLDNVNESFEAVTLITLHQAKGLEYEKVYIVGNGGRFGYPF
jgi:Superfamily I DNA and RNA helicases